MRSQPAVSSAADDAASAPFGYPELTRDGILRPAPGQQRSTFLHGCDQRSWAALRRHSNIERVSRGNSVFRQGDTDRSLFVVVDGSLVVEGQRQRRPPVRFEPGDVFGELTFFDGLPRAVTVTAAQDSHVLRIRHESFDVLAAHDPALARHLLMDLGRAMAAQLRVSAARRS